jgi:beta-lactamase regulating signal transducer with metallopeptidase domain
MIWLLTNTLWAGVLALATAAVCRWIRPRPALAHVLWGVVLLRLCWPPLPAIELPVLAATVPVPAAPAVASQDAARAAAAPSVGPSVVPRALEIRTHVAPPAVAVEAGSPWSLEVVLGASWAASALGFLAFLLRGTVRLRRQLDGATRPPVWLWREWQDLAARLAVAAPPILVVRGTGTPFLVCLPAPRLVADPAALQAMAGEARSLVLLHELAHLRRRDHLTAFAEAALACAFFWHPLFWLVRARLREQAELACDALAVGAAPQGRLAYAGALIASVTETAPAAAPLAVLAARPGRRRAFERRLTMILDENVKARCRRWAILPAAALFLCSLSVPVAAQGGQRTAVEVTVNGKRLDELTPRERRAALRALQQAESIAGEQGEAAQEPQEPVDRRPAERRPADKPTAGKPPAEQQPAGQQPRRRAAAAADETGRDLQSEIAAALAEARSEVLSDPDLQELGIAEDVAGLIDSIGGEGDRRFPEALEDLIGKALRGAATLAKKELADDPDLRRLGLADGIGKLIDGIAADEAIMADLSELVHGAMRTAAQEAKSEIRADAELQRLGIGGDVEGLVDAVLEGKGDFGASLQQIIEKAMSGAMTEVRRELRGGRGQRAEDEEPPAPPQPAKAKSKKGAIR